MPPLLRIRKYTLARIYKTSKATLMAHSCIIPPVEAVKSVCDQLYRRPTAYCPETNTCQQPQRRGHILPRLTHKTSIPQTSMIMPSAHGQPLLA